MKIYEMYIIDSFLGCFSTDKFSEECLQDTGFDFNEFEREFLYRLAKETYWEGDGDVLFFPIMANSGDGRLEYGAVIKQQNNGSTWIAIPDYVSEKVIHNVEDSSLVEDTKAYKKWFLKPSKFIEPWDRD